MAFGLKNARATFQRCMLDCLGDLVGQTIEVYVDDIVVKSNQTDDLMAYLELTFARLRANLVKLNLTSASSSSLGECSLASWYRHAASKPTQKKNAVVMQHEGGTEAYGVSRGTRSVHCSPRRKGLPLCWLLKKSDNFEWTEEA